MHLNYSGLTYGDYRKWAGEIVRKTLVQGGAKELALGHCESENVALYCFRNFTKC